ncbi:hypothetical protein DAPPUDRAFT_320663 [Daphnia pulex]|uniref:Uncharacterized protein n=1 Tax=Daphnia pulex TaxID=6669 RepID=E9GQT5_DAPPU|nr:hypothetical protein DAPPUDRAFT_320663 [Daphnia pulex]|eukprot:EFX78276.1 hypothetical protein DAPPUDRAFT_320663 [Daphnia pulex]
MVFPPGAQIAYIQPQQQFQDHTTQQPSHIAETSSLLVPGTAPAPPELHSAAETATSSTSPVKVENRVVSNAASVSFPVATTMPAEPIPASKLADTHKSLLQVTSPDELTVYNDSTLKITE